MNKEDFPKISRSDGLTVPPGYFEDFNKRMIASLPTRPWEEEKPRVLPRTWFQRVKPYLYMAAMFLGIWCMMKMFDLMRPHTDLSSIADNPVLANAINNDTFFYDYCASEVEESDLIDALYEEGVDPSSLSDFSDSYRN